MYKRIIYLIIAFILLMNTEIAQAQINIWKGTSVHHRVELTPYLVKSDKSAPAVIVCPGGSYFWHDMVNEGSKVAQWLNANGISAFVLRYRTAYVPAFITHYRLLFRGNRYPDALNDLQQSLRLIRKHAQDYHIDTTKIGVMGFSARRASCHEFYRTTSSQRMAGICCANLSCGQFRRPLCAQTFTERTVGRQ